MATHRPVVLIGGKLSLLPAGDTLAAKVQEVDVIELQAKEVLVAGMAVYCSAGFQVMKAKADDDTKANVLGLALSAAALDAYVQVQTTACSNLPTGPSRPARRHWRSAPITSWTPPPVC